MSRECKECGKYTTECYCKRSKHIQMLTYARKEEFIAKLRKKFDAKIRQLRENTIKTDKDQSSDLGKAQEDQDPSP